MAEHAALRLQSVTVKRGDALILQDVSLAIPTGLVTAIVGPSGAGKSTLLGVMNGLIAPDAGFVMANGGGELQDPAALHQHRRRSATVFQNHALIDRLSALDNVLLGLADQRRPLSLLPWPRELRLRAAEALDQVGLLHRANQRASKLSGGERQRVGLARALARRPRLLLADEPFSSVDPAWTGRLGQGLRDMVEQTGATLVIVLHQIETALAMADQIIGLSEGHVAFGGSPQSFDSAAQRRLFHDKQEKEATHA